MSIQPFQQQKQYYCCLGAIGGDFSQLSKIHIYVLYNIEETEAINNKHPHEPTSILLYIEG